MARLLMAPAPVAVTHLPARTHQQVQAQALERNKHQHKLLRRPPLAVPPQSKDAKGLHMIKENTNALPGLGAKQ